MSELPQPRVMPAGHALFIVVGALLIGFLLNAGDILETAERQPAGWRREAAVAVVEPVVTMSRWVGLDRPRRAIDVALGRQPTTPTTGPEASPPPTVVAAPPPSTAPPGPRAVTPADPLRMFVGGDSMVGQFGPMLEIRAERTGKVEADVIYEFESGITRPDFMDWPARLRQIRAQQDPDVIVLFFGGNDAQPIQIDGAWYDFGTPRWVAEYRRRVRGLMEELARDGRDVYWVGMPIVSSESFQEKVRTMNEIYRSEAEAFGQVNFVDSWPVFTGPDGGYSEYLPDEDGDVVDMRLNDGVHLTTAGAVRLAEVVFDLIDARWDITTG